MSKRARDDDAPSNDDVDQLRETERKLQQQLTAQRRKESSLVLRLAQQGQRDDAALSHCLRSLCSSPRRPRGVLPRPPEPAGAVPSGRELGFP